MPLLLLPAASDFQIHSNVIISSMKKLLGDLGVMVVSIAQMHLFIEGGLVDDKGELEKLWECSYDCE